MVGVPACSLAHLLIACTGERVDIWLRRMTSFAHAWQSRLHAHAAPMPEPYCVRMLAWRCASMLER
eukprot:13900244-Alexandrium_andersonii.AAC.1